MNSLKDIFRFFISQKRTNVSNASDEKGKSFDTKYNDPGKFKYEEDGFTFQFPSMQEKIKWADVERLIAYKRDLITTDEICLDIIYNNQQLTITEETPGWYQFIKKMKLAFPAIPANWDGEIIHPAFATNLIILYQREDRDVPEENNFYAAFKNIDKTRLKNLFEQNGWSIRKSGFKDFELMNSWAELILEGNENEPLLNGKVAFHKNNIILLDNLFNAVGGEHLYEFYDKEKNCIYEKKTFKYN